MSFSYSNKVITRAGYTLFLQIIILLMFCIQEVSAASSNTIEIKRIEFSSAVEALEKGDYQAFLNLSEQNKDYILFPYLKYYDLRQRLANVSEAEILNFVEAYSDSPLSSRLKTQWLLELGKARRWQEYLKYYDGQKDITLQCFNLRAEIILNNSEQVKFENLQQAIKLWLTGNTQPEECIPLFKQLYSSVLINPDLLWQRIELAIRKGNFELAYHLASNFNRRDKSLVKLWHRVYRNPEKGIQLKQLKKNSLVTRKIVLHALEVIATRDAEKANQLWHHFVKIHGFDPAQKASMQRYIALHAAYQFTSQALQWLDEVDPQLVDDDVRIWRARTALNQSNWVALLEKINLLNTAEKNKLEWRYWKARAHEELGDKSAANKIYLSLAKMTNYYGFLSADRIGETYTFNSQPIKRNESELDAFRKNPNVQRTKELYILEMTTDARREWNNIIINLDENEIKTAALLVHDWEWYDNAINTVAKTTHRSDLELRFPTPYRDLIIFNAETMSIDPSWIYGVTRRESAFKKDARSSKGAIGLMQILPTTAFLQSKKLGVKKPSVSELYSTDTNIFFGSSYLNSMLDKFAGNQVLATAAYNAGPNRVINWLDRLNNVSADIWVDTIPYQETRQYVRAVMAYATIFDWKLNNHAKPLKSRMKPISNSYAALKY